MQITEKFNLLSSSTNAGTKRQRKQKMTEMAATCVNLLLDITWLNSTVNCEILSSLQGDSYDPASSTIFSL